MKSITVYPLGEKMYPSVGSYFKNRIGHRLHNVTAYAWVHFLSNGIFTVYYSYFAYIGEY